MDMPDTRPVPTLRQLGKATVIAILAATAVLIIAVMPAEYGIDLTGVGKLLGLTAMSSAEARNQSAPSSEATSTTESQPANVGGAETRVIITQNALPLRVEELSLVLAPGKGAEIKASMEKGEHFVFGWVSEGGKVDFDFHGEPRNAKGDEFTSYFKGLQSANQGIFTAPFAGTHGWYWENVGKEPVTVRVKVSGFYEKLYKP